ncbi:MAG: 50S ribosomal protein L11 [Candidatus Micrarchaeota archaeon]|nr:50S ribosomal protein L11 [Candidatus Micrarchaeota archaeon]
MSKITIPAIVEGGRATAGPPLGPALGPLGVNIGGIIDEINKRTSAFAGLKVPVKVIVDKATKKFEIEVGSPSTGELLKKELGVEKGRKGGPEDPKVIGNLSFGQVVKVAKMKGEGSLVKNLKNGVKEVLGTCVSLGITVEGKDAREIIAQVNAGKWDSQLLG